jgi:hypothetical protein
MLLFYHMLKTKIHAAHTTFIDGIRACVFRKGETPRESGWTSDIQRRRKEGAR